MGENMVLAGERNQGKPLEEAVTCLEEAAAAPKCWACGCFHNLLRAIDRAFAPGQCPPEFEIATNLARGRLTEVKYDCLGCEVCYPPLIMDALLKIIDEPAFAAQVCPSEKVVERQGWPPLPGSYSVLRYQAPVAVCTLMDDDLVAALAHQVGPAVAIVGTLKTENLGIERLIQNVLANPHLRFVLVCGPDSHQAVGHWPGQSLVALAHSGLDEQGRIVAARGKRPVLLNVTREAVAHFRRTVEIVDLVGYSQVSEVLKMVRVCAGRNPGPAEAFISARVVTPTPGYLPDGMVVDPAGYFVVYVNNSRSLLSLEHYRNDGVLDAIIEGRSAIEVYTPAIEKKLVSRLDHATYLGQELARAEQALRSGETYVQDGVPQTYRPQTTTSCGCGPSCQGKVKS
jgi:tetrahydromethanopterin S-methyltransferase subunit A